MKILDALTGKTRPQRKRYKPNRAHLRSRSRSDRSRKLWRMVSDDGHEVLTPYARKELARRRRAGKAAKQARKVNRRYKVTGGLK